MKRIEFEVAPYALQDVINALQRQNCKEFYNKIFVTKEDGKLFIYCEKKYKIKYHDIPQCETQ